MTQSRRPRRAGILAAVALCTVLLAAACGGGDDDDAASDTTGNGDDTTTTVDLGDGGNGDCFTDPGDQTARVRFVNLFTNDTYPEGDIVVFEGFGADDACGEELATVPYGEASDYIEVNALDGSGNWSATAYAAGGTDDDHMIINQGETWTGGEQVTIVFFPGDPSNTSVGAASGSDQAFFEINPADDSTAMSTVPGKAMIAFNASALQYVLPEDGWAVGAAGQSGCLLAVGDTDSSATNVGGTSLVPFPVDPGSIDVALYPTEPTRDCSGTPSFGPVTVDAEADSQTYVFAYGATADDVQLLVLPIED